jgi:hypothetical protein
MLHPCHDPQSALTRQHVEPELFAASHAALTAAGVRIPRLMMLDRDRRYLDADIAWVEDAGA